MAQRVDASGSEAWQPLGVQVTFAGSGHANFDMITDGVGGAIFAVQSNDVPNSSNTHLLVQRVSGDGELMWGDNGVQVSRAEGGQIAPALESDGDGGAFVSFSLSDLRFARNNQVLVQYVDGAGTPAWITETSVTETTKGQNNPHLARDGNGGVIIGWEDCRSVVTGDADCLAGYDLYAQRVDRNGNRTWAAEGFAVSTAKSNQGVDYGKEKRPGFEMVSDGNGRVTFAWPDGRLKVCGAGITSSCELYAQHLLP